MCLQDAKCRDWRTSLQQKWKAGVLVGGRALLDTVITSPTMAGGFRDLAAWLDWPTLSGFEAVRDEKRSFRQIRLDTRRGRRHVPAGRFSHDQRRY